MFHKSAAQFLASSNNLINSSLGGHIESTLSWFRFAATFPAFATNDDDTSSSTSVSGALDFERVSEIEHHHPVLVKFSCGC